MFQVLLPTHEAYILPTILMLANALKKQGLPLVESPLRWRSARGGAKLLGALRARRLPFKRRRAPVFCQLNHAWKNAFYPYVLWRPLVTYTFDCWPSAYAEWQQVFQLNQPKIAFISARRSVAELRRRVPGVDFRWLPEAGAPSAYRNSVPLSARPLDVLELGRCHTGYHQAIRGKLAATGRAHWFPEPGRPITLPYHQAMEAIANAKVVVCFPKSWTDPGRAGGVETITFRYFESIFSKSLMIGHCPDELLSLLGYNPVIEADLTRPADQLLFDILPRIHDYQALVERNYERLVATWTVEHQARVVRLAMEEVAAGE